MFRNAYARRAIATTAALAAMLLGQGLVANAVDDPSRPSLPPVVMLWDGENPAHQELTFNLFGPDNVVVPGDSGTQTLHITNPYGNPSAGRVIVSIVEVELLNESQADGIYQHLTVNGIPVSDLAGWTFEETIPLTGDTFVDFEWDMPSNPSGSPGNVAAVGVPLGVRFHVEIEMTGPETLLTVFTTVRGPSEISTQLAAEFEADRLAAADEFGGALYAITEDGEIEELAAFDGSETSVHAAINVLPGVPHVATAFFDNPEFSDDLAAAYAVAQPGATVPGFPADRAADIGQLQNCFLADEDGTRLAQQEVAGWNPATGLAGYIVVPEGHHAICELVAETALLSVRKIVQDLLVADGVFTLDGDGLPVHTPGDEDLTANWIVRVSSEDNLPDMDFPFMLPTRGRNWEAEGAVPEFIKVRPGTSYSVEILAPYNAALAEFFEPAEAYVQRSIGSPVTDSADHLAAIAAARADAGRQQLEEPEATVAGVALRMVPAWIPPTSAAAVSVNRGASAGEVIAAVPNLVPAPLELIEITAISQAPRDVLDGPTIEVEAEEVVEVPLEVTATTTVTQTAQPPTGGTTSTGRPNLPDTGTTQAPGSRLTRTGANTMLLTLGVLALGLGLIVIAKRRSDANGTTNLNGDLG